jgi:hypothetical protein
MSFPIRKEYTAPNMKYIWSYWCIDWSYRISCRFPRSHSNFKEAHKCNNENETKPATTPSAVEVKIAETLVAHSALSCVTLAFDGSFHGGSRPILYQTGECV